MNVIFFDGICIMCNGFVNFISKKDIKNKVFFCDIRSEKAQKILSENNFEIESIDTIIFLKDRKLFFKSDAILEILISLNGIYRFFLIVKIFPKNIRDFQYNQISKRRFLFGKKDTCNLNYEISKKILY